MNQTGNSKLPKRYLFLLLISILAVQFFCFIRIIGKTGTGISEDFDLVLTYSDLTSMEPALNLALSNNKPLFVSQAPWENDPYSHRPKSDLSRVNFDKTSTTTDQNARRATAFIKQAGYKKVVLDVDWFHVPRALFLTRLYLLGSGVEVIPCSKTPLPDRWWTKRLFFTELYKFWGSLGRVALAFIGMETGPNGPPKSKPR